MFLPAPTLALHLCSLACALAALDGAYGLISPRGAARGPGIDITPEGSTNPLKALSAARLVSHAATLAVLWTAPAIGACFAAAIGCGWLGAAAGRGVAVARDHRHVRLELVRAAGAALMGVVLWWPLWGYLKSMEALARGAFGA